MKKYILFSLFVMNYVMCVDKIIKQLEHDPAYVQAQHNVEFLRERFMAARYGAKKGAQYGATAGAIIGVPLGIAWAGEEIGARMARKQDPNLLPVIGAGMIGQGVRYSVLGYGAGAALGATIGETKRRYVLWRINNALQTHTLYTFHQLPLNESIMVFAAYQRDTALMEKIKPYVQRFLLKKGVWEVLTQLYFGSVTSEYTNKLKETLK